MFGYPDSVKNLLDALCCHDVAKETIKATCAKWRDAREIFDRTGFYYDSITRDIKELCEDCSDDSCSRKEHVEDYTRKTCSECGEKSSCGNFNDAEMWECEDCYGWEEVYEECPFAMVGFLAGGPDWKFYRTFGGGPEGGYAYNGERWFEVSRGWGEPWKVEMIPGRCGIRYPRDGKTVIKHHSDDN